MLGPEAALRREIGWDEKDCWFAHCCMLDADERAFFAEHSIGIAHCPSSNMRLASGIAPVCIQGRIRIGLGFGSRGCCY